MIKNEENFKIIYNQNKLKVRSLIYNMTGSANIDDLEQEVFIKVWDNLNLFSGKSEIKTWIYRICYNTAIDFIRKNKLKVVEIDTEDQSYKQELVQEALMKLEEEPRMILIMFYFDDCSIKEIAQALEIKEGTVKSRLFTARKLLEEKLEGQEVYG